MTTTANVDYIVGTSFLTIFDLVEGTSPRRRRHRTTKTGLLFKEQEIKFSVPDAVVYKRTGTTAVASSNVRPSVSIHRAHEHARQYYACDECKVRFLYKHATLGEPLLQMDIMIVAAASAHSFAYMYFV